MSATIFSARVKRRGKWTELASVALIFATVCSESSRIFFFAWFFAGVARQAVLRNERVARYSFDPPRDFLSTWEFNTFVETAEILFSPLLEEGCCTKCVGIPRENRIVIPPFGC